MHLYEIPSALRDALDNVTVTEEGEVVGLEQVEQLEMEASEKLSNCANYLTELRGDYETIDNEIKRLQAKKKAVQNKGEKIRDLMLYALESLGGKLKTATHSMSVRTTMSVNVLDVEKLPTQFINTTITPKKADMLKALKAGEEIAGVELVESKSIQIR